MHVEAIKDGYRSQLSPTFAPSSPVIQNPDGTGSSIFSRALDIPSVSI